MPKKAAEIAGVSVQILRAWEKAGTIPCRRTSGNTRQYDISEYIKKTEIRRNIICYCCVSSTKQKEDLRRQIEYMTAEYPGKELEI